MINVPNGRYDVKIALKLVDTPDTVQIFPPPATSAMKFTLNNELQEPTPLAVHDQLILDKPFVLVNESEIRLKWVEGYVSLIWIEIVPLNAPPENAGQTVEYSSRSKVGANCFKEPLNCLFTERELQGISCPGKLVKILGNAKDKRLACMNKCVASD